jgi:hypothetical protein
LDEGSLYINTKWILMKKEQGRRKRQESWQLMVISNQIFSVLVFECWLGFVL